MITVKEAFENYANSHRLTKFQKIKMPTIKVGISYIL
jgi:hypothetical protein